MKEKFVLIIETLHVDDSGDQENVSTEENFILIVVFFFSFGLPFARCFYVNKIHFSIKNTCR